MTNICTIGIISVPIKSSVQSVDENFYLLLVYVVVLTLSFWATKQRESGGFLNIFIRTYERFWGNRKFAIGVFGLKTAAQKRPSATMECFWSTF